MGDLKTNTTSKNETVSEKLSAAWESFKRFAIGPVYERNLTLLETLTENLGTGPHGYGDPDDWSIRKEEYYLLPRMVWKKVRFEKCKGLTDAFFKCLGEKDYNTGHCKEAETAMHNCRREYYELRNDEVELECITEYLPLRNEFRRTANPEILQQMKEMMLAPRNEGGGDTSNTPGKQTVINKKGIGTAEK